MNEHRTAVISLPVTDALETRLSACAPGHHNLTRVKGVAYETPSHPTALTKTLRKRPERKRGGSNTNTRMRLQMSEMIQRHIAVVFRARSHGIPLSLLNTPLFTRCEGIPMTTDLPSPVDRGLHYHKND